MAAVALLLELAVDIPIMLQAGRAVADVLGLIDHASAVVTAAQAEGREISADELDAYQALRAGDVAIIDAAVPLAL